MKSHNEEIYEEMFDFFIHLSYQQEIYISKAKFKKSIAKYFSQDD